MVTTNETDVNYVSWTIGLEIAKLTRYVKQTNKQKIERQQDSSFFFYARKFSVQSHLID